MKKLSVLGLAFLLVLGFLFTGCSTDDSDEDPNTDPKIIKISFVGYGEEYDGSGKVTYNIFILEYEKELPVNVAECIGESGFSKNIMTFELKKPDTDTPWTGNGSYYINLREDPVGGGGGGRSWFYTAGKDIPPETNVTTFNINQSEITINFGQFALMK